jgi:hypothetical protein
MAKIHQEVLRAQYFAVKSLSRNRGVNGGTDLAFSSPIPDLKSLVEMAQSPRVLGKVFDAQSVSGTAQEGKALAKLEQALKESQVDALEARLKSKQDGSGQCAGQPDTHSAGVGRAGYA